MANVDARFESTQKDRHEPILGVETREQGKVDIDRLARLAPSQERESANEAVLPVLFVADGLERRSRPDHLSHCVGLS